MSALKLLVQRVWNKKNPKPAGKHLSEQVWVSPAQVTPAASLSPFLQPRRALNSHDFITQTVKGSSPTPTQPQVPVTPQPCRNLPEGFRLGAEMAANRFERSERPQNPRELLPHPGGTELLNPTMGGIFQAIELLGWRFPCWLQPQLTASTSRGRTEKPEPWHRHTSSSSSRLTRNSPSASPARGQPIPFTDRRF